MEEVIALCWMLVTALLWGLTDPMMKLYGGDTDSNQNKNESTNNETSEKGLIFSTLKLFKRWKFLLSFLLNQLGR